MERTLISLAHIVQCPPSDPAAAPVLGAPGWNIHTLREEGQVMQGTSLARTQTEQRRFLAPSRRTRSTSRRKHQVAVPCKPTNGFTHRVPGAAACDDQQSEVLDRAPKEKHMPTTQPAAAGAHARGTRAPAALGASAPLFSCRRHARTNARRAHARLQNSLGGAARAPGQLQSK